MKKNPDPAAQAQPVAQIGAAQRRIVDILKTRPNCTTATLASLLDVTSAAIRLQMNELLELGLVRQQQQAANGRGRPSAAWSLSGRALALFADRHGELSLELIQSLRSTLGEQALIRVLDKRNSDQLDQLNKLTPENANLARRIKVLTSQRSSMGYMAELKKKGKSWQLIEHHCPVCNAARHCENLCSNELRLFQDYLGQRVSVQRQQHLISGDAHCAYRIELQDPA